MIAIVDYGVGNLANVERGLQRAGATAVRVTRSEDEILSARAVVLARLICSSLRGLRGESL